MRLSLRRTVVLAISLLAAVVVALSVAGVGPAGHIGQQTSQFMAGGMGPHS